MRNSWLFKLLGAFLLVIAVVGIITSLMTSRATFDAFDLYTSRNGEIWAGRLAPQLAQYYQNNQSWDGIDLWIQENLFLQNVEKENSAVGGGQTSSGIGQGHGPGSGMGMMKQGEELSMMGAFGQRIILADESGLVIYDSLDELVGRHFSDSNLKNGTAITTDARLVGKLFVTTGGNPDRVSPADEFLLSVRRAVTGSTIVAGIIALVLGVFLFIQMTAPLRKLRHAASAIAVGDLSKRVDIQGRDEFAELGKTFNSMAENLALAEQQRRHLMADVAHELRTPLTAIQGTLEGMQDGVLPMDAEQLEALVAETNLLNRLIGDLRLLSLAEARQLKLEKVKIDLARLVGEVVERSQTIAAAKKITVLLNNQADQKILMLDPQRFTQVLNNLIHNALQYTPQGGEIIIEFMPIQSSSITISVTDTGSGISAADLPHVFDRFYRADKSRTRMSGGSGLGLAIVKELVEAHGGEVSVQSPVFSEPGREGYGSRFLISLPLVEPL